MAMEHRWNSRKSISMPVTINGAPAGPVHGRLKNIGLGGMCVSLRTRLQQNSVVELILALPQGTLSRIVRVQAMVVWAGQEAAGLMFCHFDKATIQVLQHLLYAKSEATREQVAPVLAPSTSERAQV
jgi:hypothetical protein